MDMENEDILDCLFDDITLNLLESSSGIYTLSKLYAALQTLLYCVQNN